MLKQKLLAEVYPKVAEKLFAGDNRVLLPLPRASGPVCTALVMERNLSQDECFG